MIPQQIIKKSALAILFIFTVLFLSACWDREEVNDLALVTATGIDKKANNKIELSVLVFIPKGGGSQQSMDINSSGNSSNVLVRSAEGTTIADAMSKLQEKLPRTIFLGIVKCLFLMKRWQKTGFVTILILLCGIRSFENAVKSLSVNKKLKIFWS
ncbi:hypothetical protein RCG21_30420 [Bacillus salipaludis]|uniref:Spore germination protein N-terminal domain-containing protein n=1 Tax=Bacillus salipaludis TaxID=2547811 RepID=A0AA90TFI6_9BACI|nr:hypothetical protein [Bacillus salipaludis]MDQ6600567.1 hypothetical protein [Bacillus salipaludis]